MAMLRRIKYNLSRNGINTSAVCKRIFFIQRKTEQSLLCSDVVRVAGLEPVQSCLHKNLNLARLPIPPYPHIKFCPLNFARRGHPRRSLLSDESYFRACSANIKTHFCDFTVFGVGALSDTVSADLPHNTYDIKNQSLILPRSDKV
jgi:hypothetical protein